MDWLALLGPGAIGVVLGIVGKELFGWLRAERDHRLQLRGKFFDAKLEASILIIRQLKTAAMTLRAFTTLVKENEETGGYLHPTILNSLSQSWGKSIEGVNQEAAGTIALLGFYYDEEVVRLADSSEGLPTPLFQKLSEFLYHVENSTQAQNVLNQPVPPSPDLAKAAEERVAFHDQQMRAAITDLSKLADALNDLANRLVTRMKEDYKGVRF